MCPLGAQRHHESAPGRARGRPFGTEKISTFFAFARNFVCSPATVFPDQETTIEHLFANDRLSEHIDAWVTSNKIISSLWYAYPLIMEVLCYLLLSRSYPAVATFGGATYAAKCEMRDLHSAASHHQVGELAEDAEPLEPMPEPMCSA